MGIKPSCAFKCKQRQEKEDIRQKLRKIDNFLSAFTLNISDNVNMSTVVQAEKSTDEDQQLLQLKIPPSMTMSLIILTMTMSVWDR